MKRLIFAIVLACASAAQASTWQYVGNHVFRGDQFYWYAAYDCNHCVVYRKLAPVEQLPAVGSPDFWTRMGELGAYTEEKQSEAAYINARYPGRYPVGASTLTGYSVLTQGGYVQGGTTLQATGPAYSAIDVNGIIHEAQRLQELAGINSSSANAQVNSIVNTAVEGNSAAARIAAAGQVAAATIAAASPPVQQTTVFQATRAATMPGLQAQAAPSVEGGAVSLLSHGLLNQYCAKCHNPNKLSGGLDLTVDPAQLAPVRDKIEAMIRSGKMPKQGPPLIESVTNGILAGIPSQPQRFATPQAETPPPPEPMQ